MLSDHQNYNIMTTKTTLDLLQELGRMNFHAKGEVEDLIDAETDCTSSRQIKGSFVPHASCLVTKKLPPAGYNNMKSRCKDCKVAVHQS